MRFRKLLGITNKPVIHTYRGFGSKEKVVVVGRVTESQKHVPENSSRSNFAHAIQTLRSYLARPISGVEIKIEFANTTAYAVTGPTGMFIATILPKNFSLPKRSEWAEATVSSVSHLEVTPVSAPILIEGEQNSYGIISDIDDTVLVSNATRKAKLLYTTFFRATQRRSPFVGVSDLYKSFVAGKDMKNTNPVFYVSSSHWNLYRFLKDFFSLNQLPRGPLFLKRTSSLKSILATTGTHDQKHDAIVTILNTYPKLSFILIGDSGQKDAEIYSRIAKEFPNRIKTIYIRDVSIDADKVVKEAIATVRSAIPVISAKTSLEIAEHAFAQGLIAEASLQRIRTSGSTITY